MRKIPTLLRRDPEDMRRVLSEVTPGCEWVLAGEGVATRKYDGTCVALFPQSYAGELTFPWWARREVKPGKQPPANFLPLETDEATGKTVGWEPIEQSPFAKFHAEALMSPETPRRPDLPGGFGRGTYELVGPKINGNPEGYKYHALIRHADAARIELAPEDLTFERLAEIMEAARGHFEGIVWHHPDGRMAKLKVRDFPRA